MYVLRKMEMNCNDSESAMNNRKRFVIKILIAIVLVKTLFVSFGYLVHDHVVCFSPTICLRGLK